jgi:hypothetical protein
VYHQLHLLLEGAVVALYSAVGLAVVRGSHDVADPGQLEGPTLDTGEVSGPVVGGQRHAVPMASLASSMTSTGKAPTSWRCMSNASFERRKTSTLARLLAGLIHSEPFPAVRAVEVPACLRVNALRWAVVDQVFWRGCV